MKGYWALWAAAWLLRVLRDLVDVAVVYGDVHTGIIQGFLFVRTNMQRNICEGM